ncbi:uncharacterized protein [Bemisia tabaci]|uniref:uncharacterized protein isoform X3 n=1 Tax=Bemisia tabaci TaxID=7038 RepID=UPI003B27FD4F
MQGSRKMLREQVIGCVLAVLLGPGVLGTLVKEAAVGEVAVLPCPSNDSEHRFQFWQINEDLIIGPGNALDHHKYKYDVLTGTLTIKGVSSRENGVYTCVCKKLGSNSSEPIQGSLFRSKSIELVVKKDWEVVYETDHMTNVFRVIIVLSVLIILAALGYIIHTMKRNSGPRFRAFLEDADAEEELITNRTASPYKTTVIPTSSLDTSGAVDTDFPKEFTVSVHSPHDGR